MPYINENVLDIKINKILLCLCYNKQIVYPACWTYHEYIFAEYLNSHDSRNGDLLSELGIYRRKQESKKTRKHAFDQESD